MNPILISPPLIEPVSLAEAKIYLRIDHNDEDDFINHLIVSARENIEGHLDIQLIEQTWQWRFSSFEGVLTHSTPKTLSLFANNSAFIAIPKRQFISLLSIQIYDQADVATAWALSNISVAQNAGRIYLAPGKAWPKALKDIDGIELNFKVGFGANAENVPALIRQTLLQMVGCYYEQRGSSDQPSPPLQKILEQLNSYSQVRL